MTKREREVERLFVKAIEQAGGKAYKWVSPGTAGVPDRIAILPGGKIWFVELKAERGALRPIQQVQHDRLRALGCDVTTCTGTGGVAEIIDRIRRNA